MSQNHPHVHGNKTNSSHNALHSQSSNVYVSNYSMTSQQSDTHNKGDYQTKADLFSQRRPEADISGNGSEQGVQPYHTAQSVSNNSNAQSSQMYRSNGLPVYKPKPLMADQHSGHKNNGGRHHLEMHGTVVQQHHQLHHQHHPNHQPGHSHHHTEAMAQQPSYNIHQHHNHQYQHHSGHSHHPNNSGHLVGGKQDSQESLGGASTTSSESYTKPSHPMSPPSHPPPPIPTSEQPSAPGPVDVKSYNAKTYESSIHSRTGSMATLHDQAIMVNSKLDSKYTQGNTTRDGSPCSMNSGSTNTESFHISMDSKSSKESINSIDKQNNKILQAVMHDKELDVSLENETRSIGTSEALNNSYGGGGIMSPTSELDHKTSQLQRNRQLHQSVGDLRSGVVTQTVRKPRSNSTHRPENLSAPKAKSLDYLNKVNGGSGKTKVVDIDIGEKSSASSSSHGAVTRTQSHGELNTAGKEDAAKKGNGGTSLICSARLRPIRQKTRNAIVSKTPRHSIRKIQKYLYYSCVSLTLSQFFCTFDLYDFPILSHLSDLSLM